MTRYIKYSCIAVIVLLSVACSKKIVSALPEKLERRKTNELITSLDSLFSIRPHYFYSKLTTKFRDTTQNLSFKTSIKMKADSAINALITYAAIPIFQAFLTKDSLIILNKRAKCFTKTNLGFFRDNFGYPFDFKNVEELFLGIPLAYDTNQRYYQIHDPYNYVISSHRKRDIKKSQNNKPNRNQSEGEIIIKYYLSNDIKSLKRIDIESPDDSTKVQVNYISREMIQNFNIPKEVLIQVTTPKNLINIKLDYEKTEVNQPQSLILTIPESYGVCE